MKHCPTYKVSTTKTKSKHKTVKKRNPIILPFLTLPKCINIHFYKFLHSITKRNTKTTKQNKKPKKSEKIFENGDLGGGQSRVRGLPPVKYIKSEYYLI